MSKADLSREKALFVGSRLYRQASDASERVWSEMLRLDFWQRTIAELRAHDSLIKYNSKNDVLAAVSILRESIAKRIAQFSPYHTLPCLFQVVSDVYNYRSETPAQAVAIVASAKIMAVRLGRLAANAAPGPRSSIQGVLDCLNLVAGEYQLITLINAYEIATTGRAELTATGMSLDHSLAGTLNGFSYAFSRAGLTQRFSGKMTEEMFVAPDRYLAAVLMVLAGADPASVPLFASTHLAKLPGASSAAIFWCRLAARLHLLSLARQTTAAVSSDAGRISVFESAAQVIVADFIARIPARLRERVRAEGRQCFWQTAWLNSVPVGSESTAFVTRPAARLSSSPDTLYVSSATNIADSITHMIETAIGPARVHLGWQFHETVRTRLLTKPFEVQVLQVLRDAGFTAGEVTAAGVWITQHGTFTDIRAGKPRGQIDVLAWRENGDVIVADCKVLQLPTENEALRNLWSKIGPADSEKFRSKIRDNSTWSAGFLTITGRVVNNPQKAIILDRGLHFWQPDDDVTVTDIDLVREALKRGNAAGG